MWLTRLALRNPVLILMMSLMMIVLGLGVARRGSRSTSSPTSTSRSSASRPSTRAPAPATSRSRSPSPSSAPSRPSPGVDRVESISKQGVSVVSVWFNYGTNLDNAQFEVLAARRADPEHAAARASSSPSSSSSTSPTSRSLQVAVTGDGLDEKQLYDLAYNIIEPQLERIPGVASATVGGGKIREIEVHGSTATRCARAASASSTWSTRCAARTCSCPAATCAPAIATTTSSPTPRSPTCAPLRDVVVAPGRGAAPGSGRRPVRVSDVAEVEDGTADQTEIVRINGERGVFLRVLKQPGANTIAVVDAAARRIPKLRGVPPNVKLDISFDQSTLHPRGGRAAAARGAAGRPAGDPGHPDLPGRACAPPASSRVAIPLSIVATFVLLYFTGQTLNVFTLGGLALGVGRLVDDSIVELENIHRHLGIGAEPQAGGAGGRAGGGDAHPRLDHHHHRRLLPGALPGRHRPQPLPAAGADHRLRADHELLRLAHGDAAALPTYWLKERPPRRRPSGVARRDHPRLDRLDDAYARVARAGCCGTACSR